MIDQVVIITADDESQKLLSYSIAGKRNADGENTLFLPAGSEQMKSALEATLSSYALSYEIAPVGEMESDGTQTLQKDFPTLFQALHPGKFLDVSKQQKAPSLDANIPVIGAIGQDGLELACMFGILSGRALVYSTIEDKEKLLRASELASSLFLALGPDTTLESVQEIHEIRATLVNNPAIGFFYPFGEFQREYMALKAFLLSKLKPALKQALFFDFMLNESREFSVENAHFMLGVKHAPERVRELLSNPRDFLFIRAHSNGIDSLFGPYALCAKKEFAQISDSLPDRALPCFSGEACYRNHKYELLEVSAIQSTVIALGTCYGTLYRGSLYDVETSISHQLVSLPRTTALISTFGTTRLDNGLSGVYLTNELKHESLGSAVGNYNTAWYHAYEEWREVVYLFGDPEFSVRESDFTVDEDLLEKHPDLSHYLSKVHHYRFDTRWGGALTERAPEWIQPGFLSSLEYHRLLLNFFNTPRDYPLPDKEELYTYLEKAQVFLNQFWANCLLLNKHMSSEHPDHLNVESAQQFLTNGIGHLQKLLIEIFLRIPYLSTIQMSPYFPNDEESRTSETISCPYCKQKTVHKSTAATSFGAGIARANQECLNCSLILDGSPVFNHVEILGEDYASVGSSQELSVKLSTPLRGPFHFRMALLLEPFESKKTNEMPRIQAGGTLQIDAEEFVLKLPKIELPENLECGQRKWRLLLLFNEHLAIAYKPVLVQSKAV